jgi:putative iron-regulated protein
MKQKIWLGVGVAVLAGAASVTPASAPVSGIFGAAASFAEGGEGGEGGAGGGPVSYSLASNNPGEFEYDARPHIEAYAMLVADSYATAATAAEKLLEAVGAFLAEPTEARLDSARKAWIAARPAYLVTETFRFYDGPIEDVEGRINAWPLNEAAIDYVEGDAKAGIVNDASRPLAIDELIAANQASDEADVTTGWHAIEFLLWGQDLSEKGPGARPASDYAPGKGANDRRRTYLAAVTKQLVDDLRLLHSRWTTSDGDAYLAKFLGLPQREAIGRILNGMAILAGFEFMSERLAVALDSGDQEDEHSCFSDTTKQDFRYDLEGIKAVWTGKGPVAQRPGLESLVASRDKALAAKVSALIGEAGKKIAALGDPWDRVLATPAGSPERLAAEALVETLRDLGKALTESGRKLGVLVLIPSA